MASQRYVCQGRLTATRRPPRDRDPGGTRHLNPVPPLPQYPDPLPSICLLLVPHVPEFVLDLLQHRCTEPIAADPVLGRQICSKIDRLRRVAERIRRRKEHSQVKWREVEDILDYRYKSGGGRLEGDYR